MDASYHVRVLVEAEDPLELKKVLDELYSRIEDVERIGGAAIWSTGNVLVKVIIPRIERTQPLSYVNVPRGVIIDFTSTSPQELVRVVGDLVSFLRRKHVLVSLLE